jgi:hypothetical protein
VHRFCFLRLAKDNRRRIFFLQGFAFCTSIFAFDWKKRKEKKQKSKSNREVSNGEKENDEGERGKSPCKDRGFLLRMMTMINDIE